MTTSFDAFVDSLLAEEPVVSTVADKREKFPCGQCAGTGAYQGARVNQEKSHCFACRGLGYFLTSPEARFRAKVNARARAANKVERGIAAMVEQHPALVADLNDIYRNGCGSEFLVSLAGQLFSKGTLSDRQIEAWYRGKARLAEIRAKAAAEAAKRVVVVDLSAIRNMFDKAAASGLKKPAYRALGLTIKAAPAHGQNAGALYVTEDETYMGKLVAIDFMPTRSAPASVAERLAEIAADPKQVAMDWGRKEGICSCCGRPLTDPTSVSMGIGPICAAKWF